MCSLINKGEWGLVNMDQGEKLKYICQNFLSIQSSFPEVVYNITQPYSLASKAGMSYRYWYSHK